MIKSLLTVPKTHGLLENSQSVQLHSRATDRTTLTVSVLLPGQFRVTSIEWYIVLVALQHSHVWRKGFSLEPSLGTSSLETNITEIE